MKRNEFIKQLSDKPDKVWDVIIIGGGATGLGAALESISRGYETLLLEQSDFAKGTSSRSTKLVHGGVRYLAQGDVGLVREALRERGLLQANAPHLVKNERFVIPGYNWWTKPYYTIGLTLYDLLSGSLSFGRSHPISKKETIKSLPTIKQDKLTGGVVYHDGQFDDARLAINLAQTAAELGAVLLNYFRVTGLSKESEKVSGVTAIDTETETTHTFKAKAVVNATGVFVDNILYMDQKEHTPMVRPSQGVHLVLDKSFLPGNDALMIPKTDDGRVLFAVPWHDKIVVGTTDTLLNDHSMEPMALDEEVEFILETAARFLTKTPTKADVKSVFAGLRPLAAPQEGSSKTKEISRSHKLIVSKSGLITMTGGKWTTYRKMGEDTIDAAIKIGGLKPEKTGTEHLPIHGSSTKYSWSDPLYFYGSDKTKIEKLALENDEWKEPIIEGQPHIKAQVIWAVRHEMARTVEDFLARRIRMLFLDAKTAIDMAESVAFLMAGELYKDKIWMKTQVDTFIELANRYLLTPYNPIKKAVSKASLHK